jgi:DNA-binding beta-propeller fold protein YncE
VFRHIVPRAVTPSVRKGAHSGAPLRNSKGEQQIMKQQHRSARASALAGVLATALALSAAGPAAAWWHGPLFPDGRIVVANRAGKSISVIDVKADRVIRTYPLPDNGEPMYVVYAPGRSECTIDERRGRNRVFVGDRANHRVLALDDDDFGIEAAIPVGAGVWHMWADPSEQQLWVVGDIDKTLTVIDTVTLDVLATIPIPAALAAAGGRPHDVILDPVSRFAYVTVVALPGPDAVVQYSTATFEELNQAAVGEDPHLSLAPQNHALYVPCQNTNNVFVLDRDTLLPIVDPLDVPGAHGAGMTNNGQTFYTTNFPGGGVDGLFAIDTQTNTTVGAWDTGSPPIPGPHNIALTPNDRKLYVTHSGATANQVSIYRISKWDVTPVFVRSVTVGLNPFGLTYVP